MAMPWWAWLLIGIGALLIAAIVFIFIRGRKMQQQQAEAKKKMEEAKQTVTMLIIDKQKKKMIEAGLPDEVLKQVPVYARRFKVPVVKAKVQTRIMNLLADDKVFEILPVKKQVTCTVSGMYITELKSVRGGSVPKLPEKKKGFMQKLREKAAEMQNKR
jgi:cbb3-type cytochrome oxidase subunit 3